MYIFSCKFTTNKTIYSKISHMSQIQLHKTRLSTFFYCEELSPVHISFIFASKSICLPASLPLSTLTPVLAYTKTVCTKEILSVCISSISCGKLYQVIPYSNCKTIPIVQPSCWCYRAVTCKLINCRYMYLKMRS